MARVDRHWDNLKLCRDASWQTPSDHPDLIASHEAVLLREAIHEANRTVPGDRFDVQFKQWLEDAERLAEQIETDAKQSREGSARIAILDDACKRCHARYRN